jgi:hypothetical protein
MSGIAAIAIFRSRLRLKVEVLGRAGAFAMQRPWKLIHQHQVLPRSIRRNASHATGNAAAQWLHHGGETLDNSVFAEKGYSWREFTFLSSRIVS